jgi:uncharacterized protein (TIGR02231 family)
MMIDLEAPIKEVTVYADRALITRRGSIELEPGEHSLRINNLPLFFHDSLRAAGQGPQGTRILDVDITTAFNSHAPDSEIRALQDELEQLRRQNQILSARQESLKERRHWLHSLGEQSRDFARGLAQGQMKPQDCADFFSFMADQSLQDAQTSLDLENQARQLQREIDAKKRELNSKEGNEQPDRLAALIALELAVAGEVTLEISYIVLNASWHPQYDVRVHLDEDTSHGGVELTYIGMVQQSSGERWDDVELSLSTARPSLASIVPEMKPWYLNVFSPPPPPAPMMRSAPAQSKASMLYASLPPAAPGGASDGMPVSVGAAYYGSETADENNITMDALAPAPVEVATAAVEHTGSSLIFRVGRSVDVPSDNSSHKTIIARDDIPCEFDYVSAPAIEENLHLRATVTNTTERTLLTGDASIFLGSEYVGTTQIKMTAPGERFKLFLGIDDAIKVKRDLTERSVDKGNLLQNDLRRSTYAYQITVHNYASAPRKIEVRDHLPVSQHERIKVKIQHIQPQPAERSKLELLTWNFTLPADGELKLEYRFVIEHPQNLRVIGLPER